MNYRRRDQDLESYLQDFPWVLSFVSNRRIGIFQCCEFDQKAMQEEPFVTNYVNAKFFILDTKGNLINEVSVQKPKSFFQSLLPSIFKSFDETVADCVLRTLAEYPDTEVGYVLRIKKTGEYSWLFPVDIAVYIVSSNTNTTFTSMQ